MVSNSSSCFFVIVMLIYIYITLIAYFKEEKKAVASYKSLLSVTTLSDASKLRFDTNTTFVVFSNLVLVKCVFNQ